MIYLNWDVIVEIYSTTLTFFFFAIGFLLFFVSYKGKKAKNRYGAISTIICGGFFLIFGFYNNIFGFFPYPFTGWMVWWIGIMLSINLIFAFLIHRAYTKINDNKSANITPGNDKECDSFLVAYLKKRGAQESYRENISIKMESIRKSFHLAGLLMVLAYYGFFFIPPLTQIVNDSIIVFITDTEAVYTSLWGDLSRYPYTKNDFTAIIDITMFALTGAMVFMIFSEVIRVLWGSEYSLFNLLTKAVLRYKEYNAAGPQVYLITGTVFTYLLYMIGLIPESITFTGILVACFSDAIAALVGRKYGKHKVKCIGGEMKTVEGFIAGTVLSFLIGLIFVGPFYALVGALIFLILDYFPLVVADNILNPIFISIGIGIVYFFIGLPLGFVI
ncbi:MAG: conserved membrane protein of unknown function [Promethearchaeota archaeon]|nr:MAG: conserved membrane protein of unknown function [Candidatus Lokiarchaeota archaeon]